MRVPVLPQRPRSNHQPAWMGGQGCANRHAREFTKHIKLPSSVYNAHTRAHTDSCSLHTHSDSHTPTPTLLDTNTPTFILTHSRTHTLVSVDSGHRGSWHCAAGAADRAEDRARGAGPAVHAGLRLQELQEEVESRCLPPEDVPPPPSQHHRQRSQVRAAYMFVSVFVWSCFSMRLPVV